MGLPPKRTYCEIGETGRDYVRLQVRIFTRGITRWDGETGRFIVRFDKSPGVSDLAYGFEAWSGPDAGESWSGASLEVLTDNEAVLEAADVSTPTEAGSRMIRLRVTRQ